MCAACRSRCSKRTSYPRSWKYARSSSRPGTAPECPLWLAHADRSADLARARRRFQAPSDRSRYRDVDQHPRRQAVVGTTVCALAVVLVVVVRATHLWWVWLIVVAVIGVTALVIRATGQG